jgi:adenylate cyclase
MSDDAAIEWVAGLFPFRAPRGRPVTLMFTDIAGFTTHAATLGDRAALRLLRRHDRAVLPALRWHGGQILKRLGDGLMAAFPSPADAVAAALAMQHAAARRPAVGLRIGIHSGAASSRAGDLVGHDVNVASRIADRAERGRVLVSDAVRAAASTVPARFRSVAPLELPGISPTPLYCVTEAFPPDCRPG